MHPAQQSASSEEASDGRNSGACDSLHIVRSLAAHVPTIEVERPQVHGYKTAARRSIERCKHVVELGSFSRIPTRCTGDVLQCPGTLEHRFERGHFAGRKV